MGEKSKPDPELALMGRIRKVLDTLPKETSKRIVGVIEGGVETPETLQALARVSKMIGEADDSIKATITTWAVNRWGGEPVQESAE